MGKGKQPKGKKTTQVKKLTVRKLSAADLAHAAGGWDPESTRSIGTKSVNF